MVATQEVGLIVSSSVFISLVVFVFTNNYKNDNKVNRVYERLDEIKEFNDKTFVRSEMCQVLHKQIKDDIQEIKSDVKQLLKLKKTNGD